MAVNRPVKVVRRATGAMAAVQAAVVVLSLHAVAVVVLVVLIVVGAICWTITDADRSERLAMLIDAIRGSKSLRLSGPRQAVLPPATKRGRALARPISGSEAGRL